MGTVAARVHAGIALLDERRGLGWVHEVDPDTLRMESTTGCVLGQLYDGQGQVGDYDQDGYFVAVDALDLCAAGTIDAGFDQQLPVTGYAALTRVWAYAIRRLQASRPGGGV